MANSTFQKNKALMSPVSVPNGGTGRTSLDDKSVLIGAGIGNVSMTPPGTAGNALVSDGNSFVSGLISPGDGTITYAKLGSDLVGKVTASTTDIDWSTASLFTKTLTAGTTFTFSNYQLNKVIVLIIQGNYSLKLPNTVKIISGMYDGTKINYITLHCIKATASQEVWASINNK